DGVAGLATVKAQGGVAIVQDPEDALYAGMPRAAIEMVDVDEILPLSEIGAALARLSYEPVKGGKKGVSEEIEHEAEMAELDVDAMEDENRPGVPSAFACPDCGGVLWELSEEQLMHFRCRVGHAWSVESLLAEQSEQLETALWTALRALEERASLTHRLALRL